MREDEMYAKLKQEIDQQQMAGQAVRGIGNAVNRDCYDTQVQTSYRLPTLREEAEKQIGYHREQADKADRAIAFLRDNPAFDEFVRLVRAGVIQF